MSKARGISTDTHYGHVALGSVTQGSANAALGGQIADDTIAPDISLNAFGKFRHGMLVWDVLSWKVDGPTLRSDNFSAGTTEAINEQWQIHQDNGRTATVPTAAIGPNNNDWVAGRQEVRVLLDDVDGATIQTQDRYNEYPVPQQTIDGDSFGKLLTAGHYHMFVDSNGYSTAETWSFGMDARRALVPLDEAFFDQRAIAELLLAAQVLQFR